MQAVVVTVALIVRMVATVVVLAVVKVPAVIVASKVIIPAGLIQPSGVVAAIVQIGVAREIQGECGVTVVAVAIAAYGITCINTGTER